jgi:dCTP deaminase
MILSAVDLNKALEQGTLGISPLSSDTVRENGVDLRFSDEIVRLQSTDAVLDIQSPNNEGLYFKEKVTDSFVLGKYEKVLVATLERVKLSNELMAFCQLRSTFSRAGVILFRPRLWTQASKETSQSNLRRHPFPVRIPSKHASCTSS